MPERIVRRATGRLLPIDEVGRVLLMHGYDPADPRRTFWFSIGGGVEPGETTADAAVREAHEESGLQLPATAVGEPVWQAPSRFTLDGMQFEQSQDFYVARVAHFQPTLDGLEDYEKKSVDGCQWWSMEELRSLPEPYYPEDLIERLVGLV